MPWEYAYTLSGRQEKRLNSSARYLVVMRVCSAIESPSYFTETSGAFSEVNLGFEQPGHGVPRCISVVPGHHAGGLRAIAAGSPKGSHTLKLHVVLL